jgi:hypothetical protein
MLHCSCHTIHTLDSDLFCNYKHFASDERESETLDDGNILAGAVGLVDLHRFTGRFTIGTVANRE